jgi:hypothetical protein
MFKRAYYASRRGDFQLPMHRKKDGGCKPPLLEAADAFIL